MQQNYHSQEGVLDLVHELNCFNQETSVENRKQTSIIMYCACLSIHFFNQNEQCICKKVELRLTEKQYIFLPGN